jgi:DNA-binding NtrC family response regulator
MMLERLGYVPLASAMPSDALHKARSYGSEIRLLVSDVIMPEMDGHELMQSIRNVIPGLRCVFTSGYPADVIAHRGKLDDGVYFVKKPYSMKDLAFAVREALDQELS